MTRPTLRMLLSRCEEYGDCMLWTGAGRDRTPRVHVDGRTLSLRRYVYAMHRGVAVESLPAGLMCVPKCGDPACIAPEHLVMRTKQRHQRELAKLGIYSAPEANARRAAGARRSGHARMTMELASWVRESRQPAVEVARCLGVSRGTIDAVRQMRAWVATARPARSVFDLGAALGLSVASAVHQEASIAA